MPVCTPDPRDEAMRELHQRLGRPHSYQQAQDDTIVLLWFWFVAVVVAMVVGGAYAVWRLW